MVKTCHCPKVGGGGGEPLARAGQWLSCPTVTCRHSCLPRMEAELIAGEMTAPNITFGLRCLPGCLLPTCILGTKSAVCVTGRILQGDCTTFHVSPHPQGFSVNIFYLQ